MVKDDLYQERLTRIQKAIDLEPADRVPVIFSGVAFAPRWMGTTMARFCADPDAAAEVNLSAMKRLGAVDGCNQLPVGRIDIMLSLGWLSRIAVPGRELPEESLWQVQEAEVMMPSDYDVIIQKGWSRFREEYLPRILDVGELGSTLQWLRENAGRVFQQCRDEGFVPLAGATTSIPFEYLCGGRSMQRFFLDLYRAPDRVKAAMDVMLPDIIRSAVKAVKVTGALGAWVGGWRSASALVSPKIWDRFVFPYMYEVVNALAENDILAILHLDQDWTRDLARLRELPAKKCILNPDGTTDVRKAKHIVGDRMAIMGDVPAALFATGTPEDVYDYVRALIRDVGPTGLLLCPGCDAPMNTKPENMEAFVAAGRECGTHTGVA